MRKTSAFCRNLDGLITDVISVSLHCQPQGAFSPTAIGAQPLLIQNTGDSTPLPDKNLLQAQFSALPPMQTVESCQQGRSAPPPKPWERARASDGPSTFAPPSNANSTASVVAVSGVTSGTSSTDQKDGRNITITDGVTTGRPMPPRPWDQNRNGYRIGAVSSYGGYGGGMYGGGLGSSSYGGGVYGGGLGSSMYGSSYSDVGSGMYGSRNGGYGGYGGTSGGYGGGYGYGMGGIGVGPCDPKFPGGPPQPPNFWQSLL